MKKILFFIESLANGGAEKVLSDMICNLDSFGYDIAVCTVTDGGVYQNKVSNSCKYYSFLKMEDYYSGGLKKILFFIKTKAIYKLPAKLIYRRFIREKYDIEVAFIEGFATKLIAASSNVQSKKIAWVHTDMEKNTYADKYHRTVKSQILTYKKYHKIVCVSQDVKEIFERKFKINENTCVLYNLINEGKIIELSKQSIMIKKRKSILLCAIGIIEKEKGYIRLLKCVNKVVEKYKDFEIWIIGEGSLRNELEEYIKVHKLDDNIILLGFQKNPYKYLNCCDAFICSSYAEGFSTAATESLILGKPVFTVNCSGMQELIGDSKCGDIVPNNDNALFELLQKIVSKQYPLEEYKNSAIIRSQKFKMSMRLKELHDLFDS